MLSIDQVKLLETKVEETLEYIRLLTDENASLRKKLDSNQKRIDELEVLISRFKEEQGRIEDGILSALDRLSQFEIAVEKSIAGKAKEAKPAAAGKKEPEPKAKKTEPARESKPEPKQAPEPRSKPEPSPQPVFEPEPVFESEPEPEYSDDIVIADIEDPLGAEDSAESETPDISGEELDIF